MKKHHCFWCGEYLGEYDNYYNEIETCRAPECEKALQDEERGRDEWAREEAARDNYGRYR